MNFKTQLNNFRTNMGKGEKLKVRSIYWLINQLEIKLVEVKELERLLKETRARNVELEKELTSIRDDIRGKINEII